jgi:DNA invertase Pin-like site-specific DNA recombinase
LKAALIIFVPATRWWCGLDRLARSVRQLVETAEDLAKREIGLRVLTQAIDTTSPGGRLVFHVFAAVAEFERELTLSAPTPDLPRRRRWVDVAGASRRWGRPKSSAKAMLADPTITVEEVAQPIGVQPSTLYRHIPGGRSSLGRRRQ